MKKLFTLLLITTIFLLTSCSDDYFEDKFKFNVKYKVNTILGENAIVTFDDSRCEYIREYDSILSVKVLELETIYELALYDTLKSTTVFEINDIYSELLSSVGINSNLNWITNKYVKIQEDLKRDSINADIYKEVMLSKRNHLKHKLIALSKDRSLYCMLEEIKTLTAKLNRGEYNTLLGTKYTITVEYPISNSISFVKKYNVTDWAKTDNYEDIEFLEDVLPLDLITFKRNFNCE